LFKKCFIHIGTEKTGSTSIQRYLEKNRDLLLDQGHYYPKCFGPKRGSHYYLCAYVRHDSIFDDLRLISGISNQEELNVFREKLLTSAREEFKSIDTENLHISCENFHSRLMGEAAIKMLKVILSEFCEEFEIICYVRPQHEVAISLYSTHMKLGGTAKNIFEDIDSNNHYYNYFQMLNKWESVFGHNAIEVHFFDKNRLQGADLIHDYCELTGIDKFGLMDIPQENESLSREGLIFLREVNKYLPRFVDNKPSNYRKNIAEIMENNFSGKAVLCSRKEANNYYKIFSDSNEKLFAKFLSGEKFNVNFDKYPENSQENEFDISNFKEIIKIVIAAFFSDFKNQERVIKFERKVKNIKKVDSLLKEFARFWIDECI
jgi:hypothetical protein